MNQMDIKHIQDLIKFVAKSGVNEVSIEEKDVKITIKTNQEPTYVSANIPPLSQPQPAIVAPISSPINESKNPVPAKPTTDDLSNYTIVRSPMIGTFYRSASPDKPVFVNVGD